MSITAKLEREAFLKWVEEQRAELHEEPWFASVEQLIESNEVDAAHALAKEPSLLIYGAAPSEDVLNPQAATARETPRQTSDWQSNWPAAWTFKNVLLLAFFLGAGVWAYKVFDLSYMSLDLFTGANQIVDYQLLCQGVPSNGVVWRLSCRQWRRSSFVAGGQAHSILRLRFPL
jgi:hypothetical protein